MKKKRKIKALKAQIKDLEACLLVSYTWRNRWYDYAEELENYLDNGDMNARLPVRPRGWHD